MRHTMANPNPRERAIKRVVQFGNEFDAFILDKWIGTFPTREEARQAIKDDESNQ